jgi:eukaryotic-like serine/threonine-protein kinase
MKSESDREVDIFTEALELSLRERDAFLERVCRGNQDLRRRLEAMLRAHDRLGNFLEEPPIGGPSIETNEE